MNKTEIDNNVLSALAQTLAQAANLLNSALATPTTEPEQPAKKRGRPPKPKSSLELEYVSNSNFSSVKPTIEPEQPKGKRGRPAKQKTLQSATITDPMCKKCSEALMYCACSDNPLNKNSEIIDEQEIKSILEEDNQPARKTGKSSYIFNTVGRGKCKIATQSETVTKKIGEQKFVDVATIAHVQESWEPTERSRQPAQKMEFTCSKCSRNFMEYPSSVPQAFFGAGGNSSDNDESYSILCNRCGVK